MIGRPKHAAAAEGAARQRAEARQRLLRDRAAFHQLVQLDPDRLMRRRRFAGRSRILGRNLGRGRFQPEGPRGGRREGGTSFPTNPADG
jgi:hypothetical protein